MCTMQNPTLCAKSDRTHSFTRPLTGKRGRRLRKPKKKQRRFDDWGQLRDRCGADPPPPARRPHHLPCPSSFPNHQQEGMGRRSPQKLLPSSPLTLFTIVAWGGQGSGKRGRLDLFEKCLTSYGWDPFTPASLVPPTPPRRSSDPSRPHPLQISPPPPSLRSPGDAIQLLETFIPLPREGVPLPQPASHGAHRELATKRPAIHVHQTIGIRKDILKIFADAMLCVIALGASLG